MKEIKTATGRELDRFYTAMCAKGYEFAGDSMNGNSLLDNHGCFCLDLDVEYDIDNLGTMENGSSGTNVGDAYREWVEEVRLADPRRKNPRYPRVYADDTLRILCAKQGFPLTRNTAAIVRGVLGQALEMPDIAERLADFYLENEQVLVEAMLDKL